MKLGFIGLGRMGAAMAANLVKAGHEVSVFNRSPGKGGSLVKLGAREAAAAVGGLAAQDAGDVPGSQMALMPSVR